MFLNPGRNRSLPGKIDDPAFPVFFRDLRRRAGKEESVPVRQSVRGGNIVGVTCDWQKGQVVSIMVGNRERPLHGATASDKQNAVPYATNLGLRVP